MRAPRRALSRASAERERAAPQEAGAAFRLSLAVAELEELVVDLGAQEVAEHRLRGAATSRASAVSRITWATVPRETSTSSSRLHASTS